MPQAEEALSDRWTLVEKIDEGAMGEIYRGRHAVLGHTVAIKVLLPTITRDTSATERFLREARIAATLQHRNVVRVEDFGVASDGRPFLVMELLRGESLACRLSRKPKLTPNEVLAIVRQIAAALDTAHAAGIVHRDLKPENIFLARDGDGCVVKVLDFGVAKFTDLLANGGRATASNTLVGTPRYMSPEQARSSRELDGRSDLWALGMITYEALTSTHPFEGEAIAEILVAILTHRIAPPTSVVPELPVALDVWSTRALARSRHERFATGRALTDALADALEGRLDQPWALDLVDAPHGDAEPRRGTLRVPRPAVDPSHNDDPSPAQESAVIVAPAPADTTRNAEERVASHRSWWALALVAVVTLGVTLFVASTRTPRTSPRAPEPTRVAAQPTTTPATAPPPTPEAPREAPPGVSTAIAPTPIPPPEPETPRRRRTTRTSNARNVSVEPTPPPVGGTGLYDPTGI
jgi:serine/threonine-protein kinase